MRYIQSSFPTTQETDCIYVSFEVLTVFLDVMSCSLVESWHRFGENVYFCLQGS